MKKWALIVAGGKGLRMGSDIPKQFLHIDSKPIVVKTIERFLEFDSEISLVVVYPEDQNDTWEQVNSDYLSSKTILSTYGGETRFESVRNGLNCIEDGLVAIHDAVRPYVSGQTIEDSFRSAEDHGSGIAVIELKDSIRELHKNGSVARNRKNFRLVQTPQTFRVNEIKQSYAVAHSTSFTDDASVYEAAGHTVHMIQGSFENIKITTPDDLKK